MTLRPRGAPEKAKETLMKKLSCKMLINLSLLILLMTLKRCEGLPSVRLSKERPQPQFQQIILTKTFPKTLKLQRQKH